MNQVFEAYVRAALEARFGVRVTEQKFLGTLLNLPAGGIHQKADFFWESSSSGGDTWIADAKYKHLARGSRDSLRFRDIEAADEENEDPAPGGPRAGQVLSPDDVRQLTVYAELFQRQVSNAGLPGLMLVYPFVGTGEFVTDHVPAWNGSPFWLVPLRVSRAANIAANFPPSLTSS